MIEQKKFSEPQIKIPVNIEFKNGLIEVFNELKVIYRFENNLLIMYKSEAEAFLAFLKPLNKFYKQLQKAIKEGE